MVMELTYIKMVISSKEISSKMIKGGKENTTLVREESLNLNLILILLKYLKSLFLMVRFTMVSKRMVLVKDLVRMFMWMEVFTMDNGMKTVNMERDCINTLMILNTLENGLLIAEKEWALIIIPMEIDIKENGITTISKVQELIIMWMVIFIKESG